MPILKMMKIQRGDVMPLYSYMNLEEGVEVELEMKISEMEEFEKNNPNFRRILKPVAFGDSVRLGVTKNPDSFNDLMKTISKRNKYSEINFKNGEV